MNDFNWRNQPRQTTDARRRHVVTEPRPITFGGTPLSGATAKPATPPPPKVVA